MIFMKKGIDEEREKALPVLFTLLETILLYQFHDLYQATNDPKNVVVLGILACMIQETLSWSIVGERFYFLRQILKKTHIKSSFEK